MFLTALVDAVRHWDNMLSQPLEPGYQMSVALKQIWQQRNQQRNAKCNSSHRFWLLLLRRNGIFSVLISFAWFWSKVNGSKMPFCKNVCNDDKQEWKKNRSKRMSYECAYCVTESSRSRYYGFKMQNKKRGFRTQRVLYSALCFGFFFSLFRHFVPFDYFHIQICLFLFFLFMLTKII